ncbi:MAG: hypothetical protein WKG07_35800 [Hymenobacter sp.]
MDWAYSRRPRRSPSSPAAGTITTVAGLGRFNGDNRPATSATLAVPFGQNFQTSAALGGVIDIAGFNPAGIGIDSQGNLYIADRNNHRVRRVSPGSDGTLRTGTITTVAGTGASGASGDGGPATAATLNQPSDVVAAPDGTLYISDLGQPARPARGSQRDDLHLRRRRLRRRDRIGGDGGPATQAAIRRAHPSRPRPRREPLHHRSPGQPGAQGGRRTAPSPSSPAVAPAAATSASSASGRTDATLDGPVGIAVLPTGEVVFSDRNNQRIRLVDTSGTLFTIAGTGRTGDGQTATDTRYGEFEPNFTASLNDNCSGLGIAPPPCLRHGQPRRPQRPLRPSPGRRRRPGREHLHRRSARSRRPPRLASRDVLNRVFNFPGENRSGQELTDFKDAINRTIYRIYTVAGVRFQPGAKTPGDFGGFLPGDSGWPMAGGHATPPCVTPRMSPSPPTGTSTSSTRATSASCGCRTRTASMPWHTASPAPTRGTPVPRSAPN